MAINTPNNLYNDNAATWKKIRNCFEGEKAIKAQGSNYLRPFYPGMEISDKKKWKQFLQGAEFPNVTARVHSAVTGALLRYEPALTAPDADKEWIMNEFGISDAGFSSFVSEIVNEDTLTGRTGILIDRAVDGQSVPKPIIYKSEQILSAIEDESTPENDFKSVRLLEIIEEEDADYKTITIKQIRELLLDENGYYFQRIWRQNKGSTATAALSGNNQIDTNTYSVVEEIQPKSNGARFTTIPFWFANGVNEAVKPMLLDIVDANVHIYNKVSYNNWAYFIYNTPTYFLAGVSSEESDRFKMGGLWNSNNPESSMTVVGGQPAVLEAGNKLIQQAFDTVGALGASMFSQRTSQAESGDALKIRNAPDTAIVGMEANALSASITSALQFAVDWYKGRTYGEVKDVAVKIQNGVNPESVNPQDLQTIMTGVAQGLIPVNVLFSTLDKAELLPKDFDSLKEAEMVERRIDQMTGTESNVPTAAGNSTNGSDPINQ